MEKSAVISECGKYRYSLSRSWDEVHPQVYFVMLNPSTADAELDDPTIRKCVGFARQNGFGGITVYNLFAWRATEPKELIRMRGRADVVGPENDKFIVSIPPESTVVCAWGSFPYAQPSFYFRTNQVLSLLKGNTLCCVKRTENRPWHPLYVKYGEFQEFGGTHVR